MNTTVHYIISGKVQNVGYRRFVLHHANRLELRGFVCNLENDDVECVVQGESSVITEFEMYLRQGPQHSAVTNVECTDIDTPRVYSSFRIL